MGAEKSMVDSNQVKSIEQNRVSSQASIHITVTSYSSDFDKINIVCVCFHEFHLRQDLPVVQIGLFIPTWGLLQKKYISKTTVFRFSRRQPKHQATRALLAPTFTCTN